MKHYEWQEMVKFGIFHKLQITCDEEWNIMDDKAMIKSRVFHKLQVTCNKEWNIMNDKKWWNPEYSINYK